MLRTFNTVQKTIMICGALVIFVSAFIFAIFAANFTASAFAALLFMMGVPVISTGLMTYFADTGTNYPPLLRIGIYSLGIGYFLIGSGTAFIFLLAFFLSVKILFLMEFI